jgi:hypothetical protein
MNRHSTHLLGQALAALERHDPQTARRITLSIRAEDQPGVERGRRSTEPVSVCMNIPTLSG